MAENLIGVVAEYDQMIERTGEEFLRNLREYPATMKHLGGLVQPGNEQAMAEAIAGNETIGRLIRYYAQIGLAAATASAASRQIDADSEATE